MPSRPPARGARHLSVSLFGSMQPGKINEAMANADDGLIPRFLFAWPDKQIYRRSRLTSERAARMHSDGLKAPFRLGDLAMRRGEHNEFVPVLVCLEPAAQDLMHEFKAEMSKHETGGLLGGAIGKAPGHVLRLAAVLEYLWWCAEPGQPEPQVISAAALRAAAQMVREYYLPMAERVFGDAAALPMERQAATLARWIRVQRPTVVNVRDLREHARLPGMRESRTIEAAADYLVEMGWLLPPVHNGATGGRPRKDYRVNPRLWDALA